MSIFEPGINQAVVDLGLGDDSVLAECDEVKKVFSESLRAGTKGRLPANRTNVLFLGDKRAGKTSLKRHLLESGFDPEEPSTEGIERELVQTEEVDEHWREVKQTEYSEFQQGCAWYTAMMVRQNAQLANYARVVIVLHFRFFSLSWRSFIVSVPFC
ncbi:uncharacterized protein LOC144883129 isoform X4 [Branchiostoma floridae x Branchiostoma japonicum]